MGSDTSSTAPVEVVIWTDTQRAGRDGQIVDRMGAAVRPIGVGGPRTAEVDALARRLDCPLQDDPRQLLADRLAPSVLLGTMAGTESQDVLSAVTHGAVVMALEPTAATLATLQSWGKLAPPAGSGAGGSIGRVVATPSFHRSAGWIGATNPLEILGAPQLTSFTSFGRLADCSLFARLMDTWRSVLPCVLPLSELPLSVDASLSGPLGQAPGDLRGLTGHLAAHGRLPDGGSVLLQVSDRAGDHARALHMISSAGRLSVDDLRYELYDAAGELMDQTASAVTPMSFVDLVADHWRQVLRGEGAEPERRARDRDDVLERQALACCLACLLSARTCAPESPAKLIELER